MSHHSPDNSLDGAKLVQIEFTCTADLQEILTGELATTEVNQIVSGADFDVTTGWIYREARDFFDYSVGHYSPTEFIDEAIADMKLVIDGMPRQMTSDLIAIVDMDALLDPASVENSKYQFGLKVTGTKIRSQKEADDLKDVVFPGARHLAEIRSRMQQPLKNMWVMRCDWMGCYRSFFGLVPNPQRILVVLGYSRRAIPLPQNLDPEESWSMIYFAGVLVDGELLMDIEFEESSNYGIRYLILASDQKSSVNVIWES